ncbi:MAG: hypothetical protein IJ272_04190 [Clostridia bacterium]|nr:hypothetical protein [Clostridia bacterium]
MKLKEIIGAIFMIVLTISGIILSFGVAINGVLSSDGILASMIQTDYLDKSEQQAKTVLSHYMSQEKAKEILENVSVKASVRQIADSFDNNTVEQVANNVKQEMKQAVLESLDENIASDTKEQFATVVSDAYIKSIFPVTELSTLSGIYKTYSSKLVLALVIIAIVSIGIYIYLATGKKTYKWAIIALYNVIILNIILLVVLGVLNGIVIGNERTTAVIISMLDKIKINVLIATLITFVIAVISNYIAYFRKKKHSK